MSRPRGSRKLSPGPTFTLSRPRYTATAVDTRKTRKLGAFALIDLDGSGGNHPSGRDASGPSSREIRHIATSPKTCRDLGLDGTASRTPRSTTTSRSTIQGEYRTVASLIAGLEEPGVALDVTAVACTRAPGSVTEDVAAQAAPGTRDRGCCEESAGRSCRRSPRSHVVSASRRVPYAFATRRFALASTSNAT